jgi:leucyl/phenylalanyl-tRNA---protein transferase
MQRYQIPQLGGEPDSPFPDPKHSDHPDGLIAWGGDLTPTRLLNAYRQGIFPWYEHGSPILWWSPEPRAVIICADWQPPRRLRRTLRQGQFEIRLDRDFAQVIDACAGPRKDQSGTWITPAMREAYIDLHQLGHAHSIEVIIDGQMAGGLYGVAIGKIFFAESKFHLRRDASKIALAALIRGLASWDFLIADCQIWNPHLERLGVRLLDGSSFRQVLEKGSATSDLVGSWNGRLDTVDLNQWPVDS